jgi:hypothetical protein
MQQSSGAPPGPAPAAASELQPSAAEDESLVQAMRGIAATTPTYWLTRFLYLRGLGFIYAIGFLILHDQQLPLFGSHGLSPAALALERRHAGGSFWQQPSLFWFDVSDRALSSCANLGLGLAILVMCGLENALVMAVLWALYMSFVHVGQVFYGYGWETLLLEAGFLGIFLCPLTRVLPLHDRSPASPLLIVLLRWLLFRLMLGAGLIKLRGDPCWRDLSCLIYHYETQPNPHPLSWLLHQAPPWFHRVGVAFNHLVELVAPFFLFGPRRARLVAGALVIAFQTSLILSGNLSFLNWLTIVIAVGCFDDAALCTVLPRVLRRRSQWLQAQSRVNPLRVWIGRGLAMLVAVLSIAPVLNMLSPRQQMNTSFEPLHLVNSYGAFGSIGKQRDEVILEGTRDDPRDPRAHWLEYQFKCKPGDVARRPCWITPYHYRLDWQMWFAALSDYENEPWLVHLIYKLLHNDAAVQQLLANRPFPAAPPRYIRAERYRYRFTHFGDPDWWQRQRIGTYLPPLSVDNPSLLEFLGQYGLVRSERVRFSE